MAKVNVTYVPGEGDPKQTSWRGKQFYKGQAVELDDQNPHDRALIAAAKGNPAFNVGDEDKAADREKAMQQNEQNRAKMTLADIKEQDEAMKRRQKDEEEEMRARHKRERDDFEERMKPRREDAERVASGRSADDDGQKANSKRDGDKEGRETEPNSTAGVTPTPVRSMESPTPTTPQEATRVPESTPVPGQVHRDSVQGGAISGGVGQPSSAQPRQPGNPTDPNGNTQQANQAASGNPTSQPPQTPSADERRA